MSMKQLEGRYKKAVEQLQEAKNEREEIRGKHSFGQATDTELRNAESKLQDAKKELGQIELDLFLAKRDQAARFAPNPLAS